MDIKFLAGSKTLEAGCRVAQWGAGTFLASSINTAHTNLGMVEDGQGGIFVLAQLHMSFVPRDPRLYLYHVSAAGALTCQVIADPNWDGNFYSGTLIRSSPVGVSLTPTCIVAWNRHGGPVMAERFDSAGGSVWGAPVVLAQGNIAGQFWPAGVATVGGGGLFLFSVGGAALTRELRVAAVDSSGGLTGPANGSAIASGSNLGPFQAVAVAAGACVFWQEGNNVSNTIRARRVSASGVPTGNAFSVASQVRRWPVFEFVPRVVEDGSGGFFVAYGGGTLQLAHFATGSNAATSSAAVGNLTLDEAYSMNSDGQGGALVARVSSNKQLSVCHFNRQCIDMWSGAQAHVLQAVDTSALHWETAMHWTSVVPTSSSGAILVYLTSVVGSPLSTPRLFAQCLDAQGGRVGPLTAVSPPNFSSLFPMVIRCGSDTAAIVGRGGPPNSLLAQCIGCCGSDRGDGILVPYPPRLFCEIPVDLPQVTYGGFQLNLPCGTRGSFGGVLPLDQLARIPGIVDAPGFLTSRDAARPAWVEIQLFGLPRGTVVTIRDTAGNVAGEVRTDGTLIPRRADAKTPPRILTLRPNPKRDYVLVFESRTKFDVPPTIAVSMRFGEAPPELAPRRKRRLQQSSGARR